MFTGFIILDNNDKELYSRCNESVGGAHLSLMKTVRDRDYPAMRIAYFVQGNYTPTVYQVLEGE